MDGINISDFARKIENLSRIYSKLPDRAATIAVQFSKDRFREQAWVNFSTESWRRRKENAREARRNNGRGILTKTGRLRRSIRKIRVSGVSALIGTDVPYASIHNYGGSIRTTANVRQHNRKIRGRTESVKAHTRQINVTLPRRQFMGESNVLTRRIERDMVSQIIKGLQS
jgi:phage gpG-like protein